MAHGRLGKRNSATSRPVKRNQSRVSDGVSSWQVPIQKYFLNSFLLGRVAAALGDQSPNPWDFPGIGSIRQYFVSLLGDCPF